MNISDILYTPLDIPELPNFSVTKVRQWIDHSRSLTVDHSRDASTHLGALYPWEIAYARQRQTWLNGFDVEFPELSKFFYEAFGLSETELGAVCFLPLRHDFVGTGFWHSDQDENGLRLYLENDNTEHASLLIKPTDKKYNSRKELGIIPRDGVCNQVQQNVIHTVKPTAGPHANFLNNLCCVHAVKSTAPNINRIAVVIATALPFRDLPQSTVDLIERSAVKFADKTIYWTPPND